jgi:hypothetical protein
MRELGRRGGSRSPLTKLRREADNDLREKAKQRLMEALEGDDEKRAFEAAKSLCSFRAEAPPSANGGETTEAMRAKWEVQLEAVQEAFETCIGIEHYRSCPKCGFDLRRRSDPEVA